MNSASPIRWQRYGLTILLATLAVGCLALIGYETEWGQVWRPSAAVPRSARQAELVATLPPFTMPAIDSAFKETAERPLFMPARRPVIASATNIVAMKKGQFKLTGTSVAPDMSVAYLLETSSGKTIRLAKGRDINGIVLDTVESARVVLKQGDETEELVLRTAASPPKPATPPGVAPAGAPMANQPQAAFMPGGGPIAPANAPTGAPTGPVSQVAPVASVTRPQPGQLPITVLRNPGAPAPEAALTPPDTSAVAQRRRRFQNLPQQ